MKTKKQISSHDDFLSRVIDKTK